MHIPTVKSTHEHTQYKAMKVDTGSQMEESAGEPLLLL